MDERKDAQQVVDPAISTATRWELESIPLDTLMLEPADETQGHDWDTVCLNCRMPLEDWSGEVCAGPRDGIRGPSAAEVEDACRWADEQHEERPPMLAQRNRDEALRWLRAWCKVRDFKTPPSGGVFVDDQPLTPMPTHCHLWDCHRGDDHAPLAENPSGFMECTRCRTSWGRADDRVGT